MKQNQIDDTEIAMTDYAYDTVPLHDTKLYEVSLEDLQKQHAELSKLWWRCCLWKFAAPLAPLVLGVSAVASLMHHYEAKSTEEKIRDTTASVAAGIGSIGLFSFGLKQMKAMDKKKNEIEQQIELIKQEINLRNNFD